MAIFGVEIICLPKAGASIYDPAAYYGHREMELAMTRLFGDFQPISIKATTRNSRWMKDLKAG